MRAIAAALLLAACTTQAEKDQAARERAYQQCLDDRRTNAMAWEAIEAACREEAGLSPSTP
ncbi:MAG: hypothetical protein HXY23_00515 [Parvularculaceae bacterium]|jgi:outer membrane biogenesis lipoprotein LolB|nr:hypothetical protein [Parvularculaceae bacterium]